MDLLALAGGGLGGLLRFVPEIFKMVNAKGDRKHEVEMTKLQIQIDQNRSLQQIGVIGAQSDLAEVNGQAAAYLEAIKGQSQLTGVKWIDGVNATVRPMVTYWIMGLYSIYKATVVYSAWVSTQNLREFGERVWGSNDVAMLSMILSFWFVDRVFKHNK